MAAERIDYDYDGEDADEKRAVDGALTKATGRA